MVRHAKLTRRVVCFGAFAGAIALAPAQSRANLDYQNRGRYKEGTRGEPSTGVPLDLVAAMIDYREPYTQLPAQFQALVYVPREDNVHLTIREADPEYYYWLDQVQPEGGWQPGRVIRFQWSTGIVIRYLTYRDRPIALRDLAGVARLGSAVPRDPDVVAPVALFHSRPPAEATGYRFVFRPGAGVHLTFTLSADGNGAPIGRQDFPEIPAQEAQAVIWKFDGRANGWYRIAISGYQLSNNTRVDSAIRFYHRRMLGG